MSFGTNHRSKKKQTAIVVNIPTDELDMVRTYLDAYCPANGLGSDIPQCLMNILLSVKTSLNKSNV